MTHQQITSASDQKYSLNAFIIGPTI